MGAAGIDACFYWYDNNWHYYRKWEHLIQKKSLVKLPADIVKGLPDYNTLDFSASDGWIGRTLSCLIKLSWTESEVQERAKAMVRVLKSLLV